MTAHYRYPSSNHDYYRRHIYNPEKGTYFGRTPRSWGNVGIFYSIFYAAIAVLFGICMWAFFQTLDPRIPKGKEEDAIIGQNPGLGFRPMPDDAESTLIWLQGSNETNYGKWKRNLMGFLERYYAPGTIEKGNVPIKRCKYGEQQSRGQVCHVDVRDWEPCTPDNHFDYHRNAPCIFIKLNRIYGWVPEYYNDPNDLPEDMPDQLKNHIRYNVERPEERNNVWISCVGENPADVEYLGPVDYYPSIQGFPGFYYPYMNSEGYLSPLIAVQFKRPISGIVINIECRAWAKNIKYNKYDKTGSVHFELLID